VRGLGGERDEVEDAPRVLPVGHRVRLEGVHHVGELHRVADEEDLQVVPDDVPVAGLGVHLDREAARVAQRLGRVAAVDDAREAHEQRRALARAAEHPRRVYRSTGSSPTRPYVSK
jgi:hypothetical protein